jgi:hypothetical protein
MQIKLKTGHLLVKVGSLWEIHVGGKFVRHASEMEQAILEAVLKK